MSKMIVFIGVLECALFSLNRYILLIRKINESYVYQGKFSN
jgi:hypothetical protein